MASNNTVKVQATLETDGIKSGLNQLGNQLKAFSDKANKSFGENSGLGALTKTLKGAGAAFLLTQLSSGFENITKRALSIRDAIGEGTLEANQFWSEMSKGIPIIGNIVSAYQNMTELYTGKKFKEKITQELFKEYPTFVKTGEQNKKMTESAVPQFRFAELQRTIEEKFSTLFTNSTSWKKLRTDLQEGQEKLKEQIGISKNKYSEAYNKMYGEYPSYDIDQEIKKFFQAKPEEIGSASRQRAIGEGLEKAKENLLKIISDPDSGYLGEVASITNDSTLSDQMKEQAIEFQKKLLKAEFGDLLPYELIDKITIQRRFTAPFDKLNKDLQRQADVLDKISSNFGGNFYGGAINILLSSLTDTVGGAITGTADQLRSSKSRIMKSISDLVKKNEEKLKRETNLRDTQRAFRVFSDRFNNLFDTLYFNAQNVLARAFPKTMVKKISENIPGANVETGIKTGSVVPGAQIEKLVKVNVEQNTILGSIRRALAYGPGYAIIKLGAN